FSRRVQIAWLTPSRLSPAGGRALAAVAIVDEDVTTDLLAGDIGWVEMCERALASAWSGWVEHRPRLEWDRRSGTRHPCDPLGKPLALAEVAVGDNYVAA